MKVKIHEEDCRPRLYWFENVETLQDSPCFNMGAIESKVEFLESIGIEVVNKKDFM